MVNYFQIYDNYGCVSFNTQCVKSFHSYQILNKDKNDAYEHRFYSCLIFDKDEMIRIVGVKWNEA